MLRLRTDCVFCLLFIAYNVVTSACIPVYSSLTFLYASCLRYLSVGLVFSIVGIGPTIFMVVFYALREAFVSSASSISSTCVSIIFSEALLFVGYFWGAYHFFLSVSIEREGTLAPSTRLLILAITFLLSSASVVTGYAHTLREKGLCNLYASTIFCAFIIAEAFTSLQTSEYLGLSVSINDSIYGSLLFSLTGLHFFHVMVGVILLFISFSHISFIYLENSQWPLSSFGNVSIVVAQLEYFSLLYWHFVELLWLFIQFTFYTL